MKAHVLAGIGFDSNQYFIEGKKPILIDTGSGLYTSNTIRFIEAHGAALDKIILTHRHIDHIGGAKAIAEKFGCDIFISKDDSQAVREGRQEPFIQIEIVMPKLDVKVLEYGEVLKDHGLEVIHSPGHTIGSIVLYNKAENLLFSGDTVFAYGGVGRWDVETGNMDQLLASIERISKLRIERLYPGHGPVIRTGAYKHILTSLNALKTMRPIL
jgi:hydroxyacylglutathione hydrolase